MKIVLCLFHFRGLQKLGFESDTSHSQMLGKFEYTLPAKF